MNYLLDTHVLLWSLLVPEKINENIRKIILDTDNDIFVSKISLWEISLKYSLGKLELSGVIPEELDEKIINSGYKIIEIENQELLSYYKLPKVEHKDPFDRMIIWQCIKNNHILVSRDTKFDLYKTFGLKIIF